MITEKWIRSLPPPPYIIPFAATPMPQTSRREAAHYDSLHGRPAYCTPADDAAFHATAAACTSAHRPTSSLLFNDWRPHFLQVRSLPLPLDLNLNRDLFRRLASGAGCGTVLSLAPSLILASSKSRFTLNRSFAGRRLTPYVSALICTSLMGSRLGP
jgi:hypothetical protein